MLEMLEKVCAALVKAAIPASLEHPGFIFIPVPGLDGWSFGTANEYWGGDLSDLDGRVVATCELPFVGCHESDGYDIAAAIVAQLRAPHPFDYGDLAVIDGRYLSLLTQDEEEMNLIYRARFGSGSVPGNYFAALWTLLESEYGADQAHAYAMLRRAQERAPRFLCELR